MRNLIGVTFVLALLLSPLLVVGVRKGLWKRELELRGFKSTLRGRDAVIAGGLLVLSWALLSGLPLLLTALGIARLAH